MFRLILMSLSVVILSLFYFLSNSSGFERINPTIYLNVIKDKDTVIPLEDSLFNPEYDVKLTAFDSSGLSSYSINVINSKGEVILSKNEILLKKSEKIEVILPKLDTLKDGEQITYNVNVLDWSNSNFFKGNKSSVTRKLIINRESPKIEVIATSEKISYGGSGLIAFAIEDLPLYKHYKDGGIKKILVSNGKNTFKAYPFRNKNGKLVFLSLIAWPIENTSFDAKIIVIDKSINEEIIKVSIPTNINIVRRKINVNLSEQYLKKIVSKLEMGASFPVGLEDDVSKFQFFNDYIKKQEYITLGNFFKMYQVDDAADNVPRFNVFNPLKNYNYSGFFGDELVFKHNSNILGNSIRMGIDLFSNSENLVINSNDGEVAFSGMFGFYGNLVAINHELGLTSIYGFLKEEDEVSGKLSALSEIGNTGQSGFASINSVHFAILVQGNFVNPLEWTNEKWLDSNINHVLDSANNF